MIVLFTDFGAADLYVGQIRAVLAEAAPDMPVIDLLHDALAFDVRGSAHLLAALAPRFPRGAVFVAVVDPGVGGARGACAVEADERWFVGPDNGLLSVLAGRASRKRTLGIRWRPLGLSASFHGRDLFAPFAARLATGSLPPEWVEPVPALQTDFGAADLAQVIYVDHYGNCMTGLRAENLSRHAHILVGQQLLPRRDFFSQAAAGEPFWYCNSIGLAEIAVNCGHAGQSLGLSAGTPVEVRP